MTIAAFPDVAVKSTDTRWWFDLGNPQDMAEIMDGTWSGVPPASIEAIRHRTDTTEDGLANFLFVPELFCKPRGTYARAALFSASEALKKGAVGIIATERPRNLASEVPCLLVSNVSQAIGRLAEYRRRQSYAKFFAVTGSIGKTTTKNMIHVLASSVGPALRSIANYNAGMESINFTLSNLSRDHEFCVAEFSEVGNLEEQISLYRPQVAVITNVVWEHINRMEREGYTGDQVISRLAYLAAGVARNLEHGGICVLNADEPNFHVLAEEVRKSPDIQVVTFGREAGNDVRVLASTTDATGSDIIVQVEGKNYSYRLGLTGEHMAVNSIAAATAAHFAGIPLDSALPLLRAFEPESHRGVYIHIPWSNGVITIRDETISSSIPGLQSSFAQIEHENPTRGGRRIAILGQINGLGHTMPAAMAALAREADSSSIDRFYTIGSDIRILNENISDRSRVAPHSQSLDQLERILRRELRAGDMIVLKGTPIPENISVRHLVKRLAGNPARAIQSGPNEYSGQARRIVIGGDTYFGETYQEKRAKNADINYLEVFGYGYSGKNVAPLLQRADFTIVNLECALTRLKSSKLEGRKDYILHGRPQKTIDALKNLNVGGVLLGNNHSMDYLADGLQETLEHVKTAGISLSGAGKNREEAQQPILKQFDVDGIPFKLAVLSGYEYNTSHEELGFFAGATKSGVNNINIDRLREQISSLKAEGYFVVVSPHWGLNYCFRTHAQSRLAQRFVDIGADIILGHGPHMMNELAKVDGVWVIYSLGNFIFNSEGEYERRGIQPYSLIAELEFARQDKAIQCNLNLYPIVSCNQLTQFQPTFTDDNQFEQVVGMLKAMHYDSAEFMNSVELREVDRRLCMTMKIF
jgi:UDP-N-acetylmuramyl pentapeptide synthase